MPLPCFSSAAWVPGELCAWEYVRLFPTLAPLGSGAKLSKGGLKEGVDMLSYLSTRDLDQVPVGQALHTLFREEAECRCITWPVL